MKVRELNCIKEGLWNNRLRKSSVLLRILFVSVSLISLFLIMSWPEKAMQAVDRVPVRIKSMHMLNATTGWVLAQSRLYWTSTEGKNWSDITPPSSDALSISDVFFLDTLNGWAILSMPTLGNSLDSSVKLAVTSNGGATWEVKNFTLLNEAPVGAYSGGATVYFVDRLYGWVMLGLDSSSNFNHGALFVTSDGGENWNALPTPPTGDPVMFTSHDDGWLAGGAAGDELYVTHDSGNSWQRKHVNPPSGYGKSRVVFDSPIFQNMKEGVISVTFLKEKSSVVALYSTNDGGETWEISIEHPFSADEVEPGVKVTSSVIGGNAIAFVSSKNRKLTLADKFKNIQPWEMGKTLPADANIINLDFISAKEGWLLALSGKCFGVKSNCVQEFKLYATRDGGQTLTEITPPRLMIDSAKDDLNVNIARNSTNPGDAKMTPVSTITISNQEGYDKCEIMTVSQMQAWWNSSPYRAVGVYIGGENRGCSNAGLDSSWVRSVSNIGWGIIPIWVGKQAPGVGGNCQLNCSKIDTNGSAEAQGVAEADQAVNRAIALGLSPRTVIYYDMEGYNRGDGESIQAVQAFLNGWVRRMHERGNAAGVYSSRLSFQDLTPLEIENVPDAIWPAYFFVQHAQCGAACHNVFGIPAISDSLWVNHQRIRQTSSTLTAGVCYSNVCFSGNGSIDEDWLDGPVATAGSSCSFSVGQGVSGAELAAFQNAVNAVGGQNVLGCPSQAVQYNSFTSSSGATSHHQLYANGDVEYYVNSSRAGQAYAVVNPFYNKWASLGFNSNNPLGFPVGNLSASSTSCFGTTLKYQDFESGSLNHHLSGSRNGSVFEVHGAIHAKWRQKGFASCPLGLPISDEHGTPTSIVTGRSGRASDFEGGHIHWWSNAAQAFETHGLIDNLYTSMGGVGSWLGFPVSDEYVANGFPRSDFEGGYITTLDGVSYQAFSNTCAAPGVFLLASPVDGQSLSSVSSVNLTWNGSAGATSYDVYFGTSPTPSLIANQTGTSRAVSVTAGQTYYWKVVAKVSCNGSFAYSTPTWSFSVIASSYTISLSALPTTGGVVSGGGTFVSGSSRTVTATANSGYAFTNWTENGVVVSSSATYTFTLNGNRSLVANFMPSQINYTIAVSASPGAGGVVSGGGTFVSGSSRTVTAAANSGYTFTNWTENGVVVSSSATYTFTLNGNRSLVANFAGITLPESPHPYSDNLDQTWIYTQPGNPASISVTFDSQTKVEQGWDYIYVMDGSGNNIPGSPFTGTSLAGQTLSVPGATVRIRLTSDGSVTYWGFKVTSITSSASYTIAVSASPSTGGVVSGSGTFASGSSRTVTATANSGYAFTNWTENNVVVSSSATYTFTLNGNRSLVANFTISTVNYTISLSTSPSAGGVVSGGGTYAAGSSRTVMATANSGYVFTNWTENGVVVSSSASYTFALNGNRSLVANFFTGAPLPESPHPYSDNFDQTWVYTQSGAPTSINVAFDPQTNVEQGWDYIYVMDGNGNNIPGSPFTGTSLAGQTLSVPGATVRIRLTSDGSITYWGFKVTSITSSASYAIAVSASPSAGGAVSGGGTYAAGSSRTVTAAANSGYTFTNWTENGVVVSSSATYTFTLNGNRSLVANFISSQINYTILVSASPSAGGVVSGGGTFASGSTQTVTALANSGYTFANWTENGVMVSSTASYTFTLNGNRGLVANFTSLINYTISVSASPSAGGAVSGGGTFSSGSSRTVTATANSGYVFANWTENGAVVSSSTSYTFTLNGNRSLVANFTTALLLESPHPYTNNLDQTWVYTQPGSPTSINVAFDPQTNVEQGWDYIYVMDGNGNNIPGSPFTGASLAGLVKNVPGATVKIRLVSDGSITYWGFKVTSITSGGGGGTSVTILSEGAENGAPGWTTSTNIPGNNWVYQAASPHSGAYRFSSSNGADYVDNLDQSLYSPTFSLSGRTRATLSYYYIFKTETNYDFFKVEISINGGSSWTTLSSSTGISQGWPGWAPQAVIDLTPYVGSGTVKIRFRLTSDFSVVDWGAVVDDILITAQ